MILLLFFCFVFLAQSEWTCNTYTRINETRQGFPISCPTETCVRYNFTYLKVDGEVLDSFLEENCDLIGLCNGNETIETTTVSKELYEEKMGAKLAESLEVNNVTVSGDCCYTQGCN